MRVLCRLRASNKHIFLNTRPFRRDCEHMPCCCCNCTQRTKICQFLHKHEGNIERSSDVFLHLNSCLQTAHLAFKEYSTVVEILSSLKMEWSEKEQLALTDKHRGLMILQDPKDKNYYKRNCKLKAQAKLEKKSRSHLSYVCPTFASIMVCCMFVRNQFTMRPGCAMCGWYSACTAWWYVLVLTGSSHMIYIPVHMSWR